MDKSISFLVTTQTSYILNPISFTWEKQVSEKLTFLDIFQTLKPIHKNQVQFDSNDVLVGLDVYAVIN